MVGSTSYVAVNLDVRGQSQTVNVNVNVNHRLRPESPTRRSA
jgi:hypothetical protein